MADAPTSASWSSLARRHVPDLPLVVWMVLLTLVLGLASGLGAAELTATFNRGFGRALGEFALILLPSLVLASAMSRQDLASEAAGRVAALASPVAGAAMICPDTAYAALSPAAGRYKLATAFGAYAGFKLLYPGGPLIVATGIGMTSAAKTEPVHLLLSGALLTVPVWGAGVLWARLAAGAVTAEHDTDPRKHDGRLIGALTPFLAMAGLLVAGGVVGHTGFGVLDFLLLPKGALLVAAIIALQRTPADARRDCLDCAARRTGSLLLVIGAASAFGAVLTASLPLDRLATPASGTLTLIGLFALSALFKLAQGSSMATFAAVAPIAAPMVQTGDVGHAAAVFSICLGSFVSILPNDSYYWLVRRDALGQVGSEVRVMRVLSGGAAVQSLVGMTLLLIAVAP